jgi:glycosyltransferase involved in cell wall biosynthesis
MKLHVDGISPYAASGPSTAARRICNEFISQGHSITFDEGSDSDASIVFIERSGQPLAKKIVQRIDGIWFKPEDFVTKNQKIKELYHKADGIIFQSEFDKTFVNKWWGIHQKQTVIYNGIAQTAITKFTSPALQQIRSNYKKVFVCSANWHPQKRLKDNIDLFFHIKNAIEPSSCLIVLGNTPDVRIANQDVYYAGSLPENLYLEVYSMADWMLCLEWLPHCPNVVVEALSQNTPVICSETGGAVELVKNFGILCKEQSIYDFTLENYDNPPHIDVTQITNLPNKSELGTSPIWSITETAQQYLNFIKQL